MMAAPPPCRSHFDGGLIATVDGTDATADTTPDNTPTNEDNSVIHTEKRYNSPNTSSDSGDEGMLKPDQMDGSHRVSSGSTDTTMSATVLEDSIATGNGSGTCLLGDYNEDNEGEEEEDEQHDAPLKSESFSPNESAPDIAMHAQDWWANGGDDHNDQISSMMPRRSNSFDHPYDAHNKAAADAVVEADAQAASDMEANDRDIAELGVNIQAENGANANSQAASDVEVNAQADTDAKSATDNPPPPSTSPDADASLAPLASSDNATAELKKPPSSNPPMEHANTPYPSAPAGLKKPPPSYSIGTELSSPNAMGPTITEDDDTDDLDRKPAAKPTATGRISLDGSSGRSGGGGRPQALKITDRCTSEPPVSESPIQRTNTAPTPRGRGLRGRRQPQTAEDRDARREQIKQSMEGRSNHSTTSTGTNRSRSPKSAAAEPGAGSVAFGIPAGIPDTAAMIAALPLPGDDLASPTLAAPGDNLATLPSRPATRSRPIPTTPAAAKEAAANPSAEAYAANHNSASSNISDYSIKQRMRRENLPTGAEGTPAAVRPGAYKELPGRGLVRNETLRFSIMTSIQKKKESFRKMRNSGSLRKLFKSSRSTLSGNSARSFRNNFHDIAEEDHYEANLRQSRSIPSVLVTEDDKDKRSYLGGVSVRSLNAAGAAGGLSVARPVFEREVSTLEALCIIPGDMAVAVAMDEQLRRAERGHSEQRLEALRGVTAIAEEEEEDESSRRASAPIRTTAAPNKPPGKRRGVGRTISSFAKKLAKQPSKILPPPRMLKQATKKLNPFRTLQRNRRKFRSSTNSQDSQDAARDAMAAMACSSMVGVGPDQISSHPAAALKSDGSSKALRRNSW